MKKNIIGKNKVRCSTVGLIGLLIAMLAKNGIEVPINQYLSDTPLEVTNYVNQNFDYFVDAYNESECGNWNASYIEDYFPITISYLGDKLEGYFWDFDGENGYAVLGNNFQFHDFSISGESPYKDYDSNNYFYSNGLYYYMKNDEYYSTNDQLNTDDCYSVMCGGGYSGQEKNASGCGKIINTDSYVNDRYSNEYKLVKNKSLNMKGYTQYNLSAYEHRKIINDDVAYYSEGNCWAVSAYIVLQYLQENKWKSMPSANTTFNYMISACEPKIYSNFYEEQHRGYKNISGSLSYDNNTKSIYRVAQKSSFLYFPSLWADVRKFCNERWGKIDDGTIFETSEIIEKIASKYGYNVDAKEHMAWGSYMDSGVSKIESGLPIIWSTASGTYGSHTMAVCGYKYYEKKSSWWIFSNTSTVLFYELRDGYVAQPRYYDMSAYVGFGGIISLEL